MFVYNTKQQKFETKLLVFSVTNLMLFKLIVGTDPTLKTYGGSFTKPEIQILNDSIKHKTGSDLLVEIKELTKLVTI